MSFGTTLSRMYSTWSSAPESVASVLVALIQYGAMMACSWSRAQFGLNPCSRPSGA